MSLPASRQNAKQPLPQSQDSDPKTAETSRHRVTGKPDTYDGQETYTVVSAVYNAESYLDDYFDSLYAQTISKERLRIITVDDGSTDGSADIIKAWQERWPDAITYLHKENGGQASARNLGLQHAQTEWVTFIDPDDFVSEDYFEEVDRAVGLRPALQMVSCNMLFYLEEEAAYEDSHPLNYRFENGDSYFAIRDEQMYMQLSMATAFFRLSRIREGGLSLDEDLKPAFEDACFVGEYLATLQTGIVGFLQAPRYFYRRRTGADSTLDASWQDPDRFLTLPRRGWLALLTFVQQRRGYVPAYTQNAVLNDVAWTVKRTLNHPERVDSVLDEDGRAEFLSLLRQVCSLIEPSVFWNSPARHLSYPQKRCLSFFFEAAELPEERVHLRRIDFAKKRILIEAFSEDVRFYLDGERLEPTESKMVQRWFFGTTASRLYEHWVPYGNRRQILSFATDKAREGSILVSGKGKRFTGGAGIGQLVKRYTRNWEPYEQKGDVWIVMDRDTQADDNGEHFYRYLMHEHPEQDCFFVLRKDSPDWKRLRDEGFKLLAYGSAEHERVLRSCSKIISSHADVYIHSYFGDNFYKSKDFVFLQHGVTKDNLSNWLNDKPITLLVTVTPQEHRSIVEDGSPYVFTPCQVPLTGFPRHDALLQKALDAQGHAPEILVSPTWRGYLAGDTLDSSAEHEFCPAFADSEYRRCWESFLANDRLHTIAERAGCKVVFFPHTNVLPYVKDGMFSVPDYVELASADGDSSIQDFFSRASVCITDYSSTAFDVAYLGTPCLYYQFDKDEFFSGGHSYSTGYFDYERDGFGPVAETQDALLDELEQIAERGFTPAEEYARRMDETFVFRDGRCCERVYEAIKELDRPRTEGTG
ncbi:MAG: CDP-glycerol:glycerophosphate glycerophosphotransferase [Coriobacteriaceae bacterium]|nr:CDP-glycerol:glycerophosphate glycerophosphotransferase [Coriobacteriaceae bacterium]